MTGENVAKNGPNLKTLAQKKNQIGESGGKEKNPSANPAASKLIVLKLTL